MGQEREPRARQNHDWHVPPETSEGQERSRPEEEGHPIEKAAREKRRASEVECQGSKSPDDACRDPRKPTRDSAIPTNTFHPRRPDQNEGERREKREVGRDCAAQKAS